MSDPLDYGTRPMSPHLQVYRLPLAAVTSILNRATGQAMMAGIVLIIAWLASAAISDACFRTVDWLVTSWLGWLVLLGAVWSLWFHFLAGLRHFWYDSLRGLEIEEAKTSSRAIIAGSVVLTLLTAIVGIVI